MQQQQQDERGSGYAININMLLLYNLPVPKKLFPLSQKRAGCRLASGGTRVELDLPYKQGIGIGRSDGTRCCSIGSSSVATRTLRLCSRPRIDIYQRSSTDIFDATDSCHSYPVQQDRLFCFLCLDRREAVQLSSSIQNPVAIAHGVTAIRTFAYNAIAQRSAKVSYHPWETADRVRP